MFFNLCHLNSSSLVPLDTDKALNLELSVTVLPHKLDGPEVQRLGVRAQCVEGSVLWFGTNEMCSFKLGKHLDKHIFILSVHC